MPGSVVGLACRREPHSPCPRGSRWPGPASGAVGASGFVVATLRAAHPAAGGRRESGKASGEAGTREPCLFRGVSLVDTSVRARGESKQTNAVWVAFDRDRVAGSCVRGTARPVIWKVCNLLVLRPGGSLCTWLFLRGACFSVLETEESTSVHKGPERHIFSVAGGAASVPRSAPPPWRPASR